MLVRVYELDTGELEIVHVNVHEMKQGESEQSFIDRICMKLPQQLASFKYVDVDISELPSRENREKWRLNSAGKVIIDQTVKTDKELKEQIEKDIDDEIANDAPDFKKIVQLQEKLRKRKYK